MYSSVDTSVTPRPIYRADGLKIPEIYTEPADLSQHLQKELGPFPLFHFWGPSANIKSTQWIAQASQIIFEQKRPSLLLIYIPHLDYCLQKEGPEGTSIPAELDALDQVCSELLQYFEERKAQVLILSEYGINPVESSVDINQKFREEGWLKVREECGEDHLDPGSSAAFAVADHQIAHVYVNDSRHLPRIKEFAESLNGVDHVLCRKSQEHAGINHPRAGDLVLISKPNRWFSYHFWKASDQAPDYARTVDIHRKPGYDPLELFLDPSIRYPKLRITYRLAQKVLGMRYLMDVIPLNNSLVRGSHGSPFVPDKFWPVAMSTRPELFPDQRHTDTLEPTSIKDLILNHLFT